MKDIRKDIADLIEIGIKGYASGGLLNKDAYLDIADKVIAELDTIPTSKEVEDKGYWYCKRCSMSLEPIEVTYEENCDHCGEPVSWIEPLKPKEEVGCEEIETILNKLQDDTLSYSRQEDLINAINRAKSLLTKYSIRRKL